MLLQIFLEVKLKLDHFLPVSCVHEDDKCVFTKRSISSLRLQLKNKLDHVHVYITVLTFNCYFDILILKTFQYALDIIVIIST